MERRTGTRPLTSTEGPHRQLSDQSSPALWGELIARATGLPHVREYFSSVSPATSRALLFDDLLDVVIAETSLAPDGPLEPVHIHGVADTSLHLCLPADRARAVCESGWGEPHQYGDFGTEIMVYGPRVEAELEIVLGLVEESLRFARVSNVDSH
ncbi:MAG TPA: hypothetical protein VGF80_13600 [Galbitalea sp.]